MRDGERMCPCESLTACICCMYSCVQNVAHTTRVCAHIRRPCKSRDRKRGWGPFGVGNPLFSMLTYMSLILVVVIMGLSPSSVL